MSEERSIQDYLDDILNAVYGEEVRNSIVGAIEKCYEDGSAGAVDMIARGRLDVIEPIATDAQATANDNVLASLQVEKKFTTEGVNDINAAIEPGKYYADTATLASAIANQPSDKTASVTFAVLVLQHVSTTSIIQILIDSQWKMWIRRGYVSGSAWTYGGWQRFLRTTDLTDLTNAINTKANKNNAELTGSPVATTASDNDDSTRIATTAYVMRESRKKANKNNAELTGTPTAPTPGASSNDTTIATTQYVTRAISNFKGAFDTAMSSTSVNAVQNKVVNTALAAKANLASPALTGNPTAPTQTAGNNSTRIATTAFVNTAIANQSAATQSAKGLLSATDKTYLDGTKPKTWTYYNSLTNLTIDKSRVWVHNKNGNLCMVTFNFKITIRDADINANTALIEGLPECSFTPYVVMATKTGDSVIVGYISDGKLYTGGKLLNGKTYYGGVTYCSNNANEWYEGAN